MKQTVKRRKRIGLILARPFEEYPEHVLDGVYEISREYDYDVLVFTMEVAAGLSLKEYLYGEMNIYRLINYNGLDGIIIAAISITEAEDMSIKDMLMEELKNKCDIPVVSLDASFGDYDWTITDGKTAMGRILAHIMDVHGCKNIYILSGNKGYDVSEERVQGCLEEFERRNFDFDRNNIFYGNFWYDSGEALADRIISGELKKPDAVVCANDCMAIGLTNRLISVGIKVPEDIIVTGYDGNKEAAVNTPSITTYIPDISVTVAEAFNIVRGKIEPDKQLIKPKCSKNNGLKTCTSCGCREDIAYIKSCLDKSMYLKFNGYQNSDDENRIEIGALLNSYAFENFTAADSVLDCLEEIFLSTKFLKPYKEYYLCLNPNWLDTSEIIKKGYPPRMNIAVHTTDDGKGQYYTNKSAYQFDTNEFIPKLNEERDKSAVFYFIPMHYKDVELGYSVFMYDPNDMYKPGIVAATWLRFVSTALEMIRTKNRLSISAEYDELTGLMNRHGMERSIKRKLIAAYPSDKIMVIVIDMDGLKRINDTFSHMEGDFSIRRIADAIRHITAKNEIAVRSGGDEFYLIGIGDYNDDIIAEKTANFRKYLKEASESLNRPYEISGSVGGAIASVSVDIEDIIKIADERMYEDKIKRKKQRTD